MTKTIYIILSILLIWNITPHIILWSLNGIKASVKREASLNFLDSTWRGFTMLIPDLLAPVVVPIALIFTKWEAEKLPSPFRVWDNDLSINGDPRKYDGGNFLHNVPLDENNQEVKDGCYWSKGNHPRSFWARYVWLGFRNRASKGALMLGKDYLRDTPIIYGDPLTENGHAGFKLVKVGPNFRLYIIKKWGPFAYRFNWGFKVEQNRGGKIMPVNITFSLKGWE